MHKIKKVRRVLRIGNGQPANYIVWRVTTPGGNKKDFRFRYEAENYCKRKPLTQSQLGILINSK